MLGVDLRGALNLVGWLFKYLSPAFLAPAAIAVLYGEAVWPFLVAGAVTFACGALPYVLGEPQLSNPLDALFESMSGFSTTGATAIANVGDLSRSMAMWRQITAWIGGVGIIVLFLAVLPRLRIGGRQALFKAESAGPELGLATTIRESAQRFVVLYVGITAAEAAILTVFGLTGIDPRMTFYNAVAHSFATIATAGFSPDPRSLEPFAPASQWVVAVFMVVAGTNFALLYAGIIGRRVGVFRRDEEFKVALGLLAAASL